MQRDHLNAESIGVILVGYGYAAATFHAPLIQSTCGLHLEAVVSQHPDKVHQDRLEIPVFDSLERALIDCEAPLVVLATPNHTHYPLALQSILARRHLVIDKPFTISLTEADDLIQQAEKAGTFLSVFHNRRWDQDFLQVQKLYAQSPIGRWTHVESRIERYRPQVKQRWKEAKVAGSGLWYDWGPHLLDQTLHLLGDPDWIVLETAEQRDLAVTDDWFHAILGYGAMRVILHANTLATRPTHRWLIHGTAGSFEQWGLDPQEDCLRVAAGQNRRKLNLLIDSACKANAQHNILTVIDANGQTQTQLAPTTEENYATYYQKLAECLITNNPAKLPVSATEARNVIRWLEYGIQSKQEGRKIFHPDLLRHQSNHPS